jgi:hypothetical protein
MPEIRVPIHTLLRGDFREEMLHIDYGKINGEDIVRALFQYYCWAQDFLLQEEVIQAAGVTTEEMERLITILNKLSSQVYGVLCQLTYNDIGDAMIISRRTVAKLEALQKKIDAREGTPAQAWEDVGEVRDLISIVLRDTRKSLR